MLIMFHLPLNTRHLPPRQVENWDINSLLVADEDNNGKIGLERIKICLFFLKYFCLVI